VDVNWWAVVVPSLITGAVTAAGVLLGLAVGRRTSRRDADIREFQFIVGLICSDNPEGRKIGERLLRDAVENPQKRSDEAQQQIIALWIYLVTPYLETYTDGRTFEIVDEQEG
jgi:hypothetical protein